MRFDLRLINILLLLLASLNVWAQEDYRQEQLKLELTQDIPKVCFNAMGGGWYIRQTQGAPNYGPLFKDPLFSEPLSEDQLIIRLKSSPWILSLHPYKSVRDKIFDPKFDADFKGNGMAMSLPSIDKIESFLKNPEQIQISPLVTESLLRESEEFERLPFDISEISDVIYQGVCAHTSLTNMNECRRGLKKIYEWNAPKSDITGIDIYKKFLGNPGLYLPTVKNALKMIERYRNEEFSKSANLLDDLRENYVQTGLSRTFAEDASWDLLGLMATAGPNLHWRLRKFTCSKNLSEVECAHFKLAIITIGLSLPKIDIVSSSQGHIYSMPQGIQSSCETGKPYHFWMSAYIARRLTKEEKISAKSAAIAAYVAQKGYQVKARTMSRAVMNPFAEESFGDWNNMIRTDLAYASAGAIFGAASVENKMVKIDIDESLKILIMKSPFIPKTEDWISTREKDDMTQYLRWHRMFRPDEAFKPWLQQL